MIVRRYWRIAVFAPVVGFLIAAAVAVVMTDAGSGETEFRFWFLVRSMSNYGVVGLVIALAAVLGALSLLAMTDRRLTKSRGARTFRAALGATGGVVLLSVGIAAVLFATNDGLYAGITIGFGVVLGLPAGIVAAMLVLYADRRSRKT
jgi:4-hydroxybenzoate polyprenyltransferase